MYDNYIALYNGNYGSYTTTTLAYCLYLFFLTLYVTWLTFPAFIVCCAKNSSLKSTKCFGKSW